MSFAFLYLYLKEKNIITDLFVIMVIIFTERIGFWTCTGLSPATSHRLVLCFLHPADSCGLHKVIDSTSERFSTATSPCTALQLAKCLVHCHLYIYYSTFINCENKTTLCCNFLNIYL